MKKLFSKTNAVILFSLAAIALLFVLDSDAAPTGRCGRELFDSEYCDVSVYGKEYPRDLKTISFSGDEIDSVDGLIDELSKLPDLLFADLGSYPVSISEAEKIRTSLGDVELKCRIAVDMCGRRYFADDGEIDLGGVEADGVDELLETLRYFPNAKRVFSSDEMPIEEKRALQERYPKIDFDIPAFCDVCGQRVPDDAKTLDLGGVSVGPEIVEKLRQLPDLETVDLHGADITLDLKKELVGEFPSVRFLWSVDVLGEEYESDVEDLDLTGKYGLTVDRVREIIPQFCALKRIDLSDCGMENEELAALREEFPDTKIVWRLRMGKWSLKTDAVAFSVLIYNYNYTRLRNADIEVLKYCTDLQALDLGHQAITDISVIGEYLTDLRILILADNALHDIEPVRNLKYLHYIELFVNPYLNDITPLEDCKQLVDVNVSHLYTIYDIRGLLDLPMLERLWIEHTATSAADIQLLKDTYPNATVTDQGYGSVDQGWRTHPRYFAMINMYFDTTFMSEEFSKYDRD